MFRSLLPSTRLLRQHPTVVIGGRCHSSSTLSIVDQVTQAMKTAMKAKDRSTLATTRLIRTAFQNGAIAAKIDTLPDEQAQAILRKMAKVRKESIATYEKVEDHDRALAEREELAILDRWLPTMASAEQTRIWVQEVIQREPGANPHPGKLVGTLMKEHKGTIDGKLAQQIVKQELAAQQTKA